MAHSRRDASRAMLYKAVPFPFLHDPFGGRVRDDMPDLLEVKLDLLKIEIETINGQS